MSDDDDDILANPLNTPVEGWRPKLNAPAVSWTTPIGTKCSKQQRAAGYRYSSDAHCQDNSEERELLFVLGPHCFLRHSDLDRTHNTETIHVQLLKLTAGELVFALREISAPHPDQRVSAYFSAGNATIAAAALQMAAANEGATVEDLLAQIPQEDDWKNVLREAVSGNPHAGLPTNDENDDENAPAAAAPAPTGCTVS